MRTVVMRLAVENGMEVREALLPPESLKAADEIFLTNAVKGIQWVVGYKEKRYFNRVSRSLNESLNAYIVSMWAKRSEEHTSELQSLMRISYAVFCLKKKKHIKTHMIPYKI